MKRENTATMPILNPEMAMMCVVPVRLNFSMTSFGISF